jgi:hypothetical protein
MARDPSCNGPGVAGNDGIVGQQLAEFARYNLGLQRHVFAAGARVHQLAPLCHSGLRLFKEGTVLAPLDHRQKPTQGSGSITRQADIHRKAQPEPGWIAVNLNRLCLTRLRIVLHVRETRSDH